MLRKRIIENRVKSLLSASILSFVCIGSYAGSDKTIPVPQNMESGFPRLYITQSDKKVLKKN